MCAIRMYGCFFFKQKTAYEMRISDWSSDVCSSDLDQRAGEVALAEPFERRQQFAEIFPEMEIERGGAELVAFEAAAVVGIGEVARAGGGTIGRASCRVRVCQYV